MRADEREIAKGLLCYPDIFKEYFGHINSKYFSYFPAKVVIICLKKYYLKYHKFPNPPELEAFIKSLEDRIEFSQNALKKEREWQAIREIIYTPLKPAKQHVLHEEQFRELLTKFLKKHVLKSRVFKLEKSIETGERVDEVLDEIKERVNKIRIEFDAGLTLDDIIQQDSYFRRGLIPTGIENLDRKLGGGLAKKEIGMIASPPGLGKSTMLYNLAYSAIEQGKPALYISLETPPEQIAVKMIRFIIPNFAGIEDDDDDKKKKKIPDPTQTQTLKMLLSNLEMDKEQEERLNQLKKLLRVKYFSPGTSVYEVVSFIESLIDKEPQFQDGLILIDYLNEIQVPRILEPWAQLEKITSILDKVVQDQEIAMWVATQANAQAEYKETFDLKDIYGSKVGATKKISFGMGLSRVKINGEKNKIKLTFFKNRLLGLAEDNSLILSYDKSTGRVEPWAIKPNEEEDKQYKENIDLNKTEELATAQGWGSDVKIKEKYLASESDDDLPF